MRGCFRPGRPSGSRTPRSARVHGTLLTSPSPAAGDGHDKQDDEDWCSEPPDRVVHAHSHWGSWMYRGEWSSSECSRPGCDSQEDLTPSGASVPAAAASSERAPSLRLAVKKRAAVLLATMLAATARSR